MKKTLITFAMIGAFITFVPQHSIADNSTTFVNKVAVIAPKQEQQAQVLLSRLEEINAMDKSTLNSSEKKVLRKEVRQIKSQLRDIGGGVYLSVGAIIIIILLLILLL